MNETKYVVLENTAYGPLLAFIAVLFREVSAFLAEPGHADVLRNVVGGVEPHAARKQLNACHERDRSGGSAINLLRVSRTLGKTFES